MVTKEVGTVWGMGFFSCYECRALYSTCVILSIVSIFFPGPGLSGPPILLATILFSGLAIMGPCVKIFQILKDSQGRPVSIVQDDDFAYSLWRAGALTLSSSVPPDRVSLAVSKARKWYTWSETAFMALAGMVLYTGGSLIRSIPFDSLVNVALRVIIATGICIIAIEVGRIPRAAFDKSLPEDERRHSCY